MEKSKIESFFSEDPQMMPLNKQEAPVEEKDETTEPSEQVLEKKNHQDRRWDKLFNKLEETQERLSEAEAFRQEVESGRFSSSKESIPEHFSKLFADGLTVEERWKAQKDYEERSRAQIVEEAKNSILREQRVERDQQAKWEDFIDTKLEALEEKHGIDFTSGSAKAERAKRNFLNTLKELSEDENGNIENYASFDKTYELWSASQTKQDDGVQQKKNIAALSGQRSAPAQQPVEAGNGGWFGWRNGN